MGDLPPPNNSATIVFEPLVSSPETIGVASASLPALGVYGQEGAGAYAIAILPRLSAAGSGTLTTSLSGAGVAWLPSLSTFGSNASVGLLTKYTGYALATLPVLEVSGRDGNGLVPQSGWGDFDLPALAASSVGGDNKYGDAVAALPALWTYASSTSGAYAVAVLPVLGATGSQTAIAPANRMLLVQSPGVMAMVASNDFSVIVDNAIRFGQATVATPVKVLSDHVRFTGSPRGMLTTKVGASDTVGFGGALVVVWQTLLEENLSLLGEVAGTPSKIVRLVDGLVASGAVATHTEGFAAVAAALAINGLTATGWRAEASDQVNLQEAFRAQLVATTRLLDGIAASDSAAPSLRLTAVVNESLALDDDASVSLQYLEALGEDVLFFGAIRLGNDEYVGWVLNGGAPSEYRNYPFNGFAAFDGRYYGTADDGLFLLEGDTDAGDPIEASIKTALMDFGTGVLKRIPDVYVAFVGSDKLVLKVITPGQRGEQVETIYTSTVPEGTALHNGRIRIGQGLKSRYWQFELSNVDGAEFEIDEMAWRPMTLDRRL